MNHFQTLGLVGLLTSSAIAQADLSGSSPDDVTAIDESETNSSRVHLAVNLSFSSQYFFRGILQESRGFIFQPSVEIGLDLYESDDLTVAGYFGAWSSFHDERTGSADPDEFVSSWYEFDFYTGLSFTTGRLGTDINYTNYASPNDAFGHVEEINLTFSWDDSGWIEGITLSPYAHIAFEFGSNQADGGTDLGTFLSLGIEPSHTYESSPIGEITLSLPIEAGFSLSDYYEGPTGDESFGYFTVGFAASIPLPAPDGFGQWSWNTGIDYLLLGDSNEIINGMDDDEWIFHSGISFEF